MKIIFSPVDQVIIGRLDIGHKHVELPTPPINR